MAGQGLNDAKEMLKRRDPRGALSVLAAHPGEAATADGYYLACVAYFRLKDWSQAERHARLALGQSPLHAPACYYLGLALERQNRPDDAIKAFQSALVLDPGMTEARTKLATYGVPAAAAVPPPGPTPPPGPPRAPSRETELTMPRSEEEWSEYTEGIRRKKLIDAAAEYRAQIGGLPGWAKVLICVIAAVIIFGTIGAYSRSSEIWRDVENTKQEQCQSARSHGVELPGC